MGSASQPRRETAKHTCYLHYPRLVVADASVEVLGETIRSLSFREFERLDGDWARQSKFEGTQPVFWVRSESRVHAKAAVPALADDGRYELVYRDGLLIYNALLVVTGRPYPDPRLSMLYIAESLPDDQMRHIWRWAGVFDRTWLLNRGGLNPETPRRLNSIRALVGEWETYGMKYDDPVFSPLRALASFSANSDVPIFGLLALVISLEGFLVPEDVKGIGEQIAKRVRQLLEGTAPPEIDEFMRQVYRARSRILHGEMVTEEEASRLCRRLFSLTARIVGAAASQIIRCGLRSDDLDGLRRGWTLR